MLNKIFIKSLRVAPIRNAISILRAIWLLKVKRVGINTMDGRKDVHEPTVFSNMRRIVKNKKNPHPTAKYIFGVDRDQSGAKSDLLINPLRSIDKVREHISSLKVLSIGPRTEGELLNLMSQGFKKNNISALDLMSYSPWVTIGDMHDMPFEDNSFDVVICGWVIAYSDDKEKAASEITRVLKDGGITSIGVSYSPLSDEEIVEKRGYLIGSPDRLTSSQLVFDLFGKSLGTVYFNHSIEENRSDMYGQIITTFSVSK